jgi:hypothetical protein
MLDLEMTQILEKLKTELLLLFLNVKISANSLFVVDTLFRYPFLELNRIVYLGPFVQGFEPSFRLTSRTLAARLATPLTIRGMQVGQPGWLQVKQILCSDSEHLKAGV